MAEDIKNVKEAVKYDTQKNRLELFPPKALEAISEILTFGSQKYDAWNWAKGMDWSRVYGALQRHLNAWYSGINLDPETNKSHLAHAACCLIFLIEYQRMDVGADDRPKI
jgi:hypothetical protein